MMDIDMMLDEVESEVGYEGSEVVSINVKDMEEEKLINNFDTYPDNTVAQIAKAFLAETSVDLKNKRFGNERTKKYYDDFNMTVSELGLVDGDTLLFLNLEDNDNSKDTITILVTDYSGMKGSKLSTISINATLKEVAKEAGFMPNAETKYVHIKHSYSDGGLNRKSYSDGGLSLKELKAETSDTIEINENGKVAAS